MNNNVDIEKLADDIKIQANKLKIDNFLLLVFTADIVNKYINIELANDNVNRTELNILHVLINRGGSVNSSDIAKRVFRSPHAITRAIDKLEKEGLVMRERIYKDDHRNDRRMRKVYITKKGIELVKQTINRREIVSSTAMSCLNQAQLEELNIILKRLQKHLLHQIDMLIGRKR